MIGFKEQNYQPLVVVCAYGPTSQTCPRYPEERERFYLQPSAAVHFYPSISLLYLAGDFMSKLGASRVGQVVRRWGKGRRNENGTSRLHFCQQHSLLVALNTLFQHHPKHITPLSPASGRKTTKLCETKLTVFSDESVRRVWSHRPERTMSHRPALTTAW